MRVVVLFVLFVLMSITPPTLAVTTTATTLPVEPDGGSGEQPGEPGGRPTTTTTTVVSSSSPPSSSSSSSGSEECDPSYPQLCIPPPPPKLTCDDVSARKFTVEKPDPHNLDGDANGIGCEVPPPPGPTSPEELQQRHQQALLSNSTQANGTSTGNATTSTNATDATSNTSTPPPANTSSDDAPFIQFQGRLGGGNGTGVQNNNTRVIPATSGPAATTTTPVTKTDTFISATINGSRFANNDTIAINGTVGGQAIPSNSGKLYVELKDPHNETVMYDSANMTTVGNTKAPFSYKFVAGDSLHSSLDRTVVKPMNESGLNYTMAVGYRMLGTSTSEVQFILAYDHDGDGGGLLGQGPTTVASRSVGNNTTTTTTTTTTQEPVIPPARPALEEDQSDDSDDDDNGSDSSSDNDDNDDDDNDEGEDGDNGSEDDDNGDGDDADEEDGQADDDDQEDDNSGDGDTDTDDADDEDTDEEEDEATTDTEEEEEDASSEVLRILKDTLGWNRDVLHQMPPRWQDGE
jgi:hypothetical protein